ncbi:MAG: winged helix-turn-helix transcriptional regulator [Candidatus Aminicenantes bacterium]|nr:winged helix-turn-helix transcriptional regulator [Candidatus Aminicenantes bacterium]
MIKHSLKEINKILAALAETNRLRILMMLKTRPLAVCEIREILGLSFSTVSKHLSVLREAGLIDFEKDGKWVNYRFNQELPEVAREWLALLLEQISSDPQIQSDLEKIFVVDKFKICQKPDSEIDNYENKEE